MVCVCCAWCWGRTEDTATNIFLVWSGAQEPQSGFPDGVVGGGAAVCPQGLLPGRVLQRFVEQVIDEDGVVLTVVAL